MNVKQAVNPGSFRNTSRYLLIWAVLLLLPGLMAACGNKEEAKTVDFTKTVQVSRPDGADIDRPHLRVAVGAMISPKETFIYYRQI
ncbi:MAG: hypothetical protein AAGU11_16515, partial [Syntrophobacteraceae bacterium]